MEWEHEMNIMLAAFDRHAILFLNNIKSKFNRSGFSFNDEFKQYFLQTSYDRINLTYNQFEIDSILENLFSLVEGVMSDGVDGSTNSMHLNNTENVANGSNQIIDSSQLDGQIELESLVIETSGSQCHNIDLSSVNDPNDVPNNDFHKDILYGNIQTTEEMETEYGISTNIHHNIDTADNRFTTVTFIDQPDIIDDMCSSTSVLMKTASISSNEVKVLFECQYCGYCSNKKWNYVVHMRIHTGEKPYRCEICHKKFTRADHLKRHKVTHTKQIPFYCRGCLRGFFKKVEMVGHEKVCKKRRYECHICKKFGTLIKTKLKEHMRKHNGEKPFRCEICMMRFTEKGGLKNHLNNIHANSNITYFSEV